MITVGIVRWSRKSGDKTVSLSSIFSFQFHLKFHRTFVSQTWMQSDPIVIAFDVAEYFRPGLFYIFKNSIFDEFGFNASQLSAAWNSWAESLLSLFLSLADKLSSARFRLLPDANRRGSFWFHIAAGFQNNNSWLIQLTFSFSNKAAWLIASATHNTRSVKPALFDTKPGADN